MEHASSSGTTTTTNESVNLEWFKHFWYVFHMAAIMAPPVPTNEDRDRMRVFYIVFGQSIPCKTECQGDYFRIINNVFPFRYYTGEDLWEWTVDVHNEVNKKLGKMPISYNKAKDLILNPPAPSPPTTLEYTPPATTTYSSTTRHLQFFGSNTNAPNSSDLTTTGVSSTTMQVDPQLPPKPKSLSRVMPILGSILAVVVGAIVVMMIRNRGKKIQ